MRPSSAFTGFDPISSAGLIKSCRKAAGGGPNHASSKPGSDLRVWLWQQLPSFQHLPITPFPAKPPGIFLPWKCDFKPPVSSQLWLFAAVQLLVAGRCFILLPRPIPRTSAHRGNNALFGKRLIPVSRGGSIIPPGTPVCPSSCWDPVCLFYTV